MSKKENKIDVVTMYIVGDESINVYGIINSFMNKSEIHHKKIGDLGKFTTIEIDSKRVQIRLYNYIDYYESCGFLGYPSAFLYFYDMSNKNAFDDYKYWLNLINKDYGEAMKVIVGIIGDKNVLEEVKEEDIKKIFNIPGAYYFKINIKDTQTLDNLFIEIAKYAIELNLKCSKVDYEGECCHFCHIY